MVTSIKSSKQAIPPTGSHCHWLSVARIGVDVSERVVSRDRVAVVNEVVVTVAVGSEMTTTGVGVDPGALQPVTINDRINRSVKSICVVLKANSLPLFYLLV
jgi:hypothetical protein